MTDYDNEIEDLRVDLTDAEESKFTPLEAGTYVFTLTEAEIKRNNANTAYYVNWTFTEVQTNRKVWHISSLDFNNKELAKNKVPKGKLAKDGFFTLLKTFGCFTNEELEGAPKIQDLLDQAVEAQPKVIGVIFIDKPPYENNKFSRIKPYDGRADSLLPQD